VKRMCLLVALLITPLVLVARPGLPIPLPKQTMTEAVKAATERFLDEKALGQTELARRKQFIVMAVKYAPLIRHDGKTVGAAGPEAGPEWCWSVRFVHPAYNDNTYTIVVWADGKVEMYMVSK